MAEEMFWADQMARKVIKERGEKSKYVVAAGITPSGTIHIGNFREMITVELVARALKSAGKQVRFIYSWDNYDRIRKIPANVPKREELEKYMGQPVVDVPDTFGCHKSYAEHMEKDVADALPVVGIMPEFISQSKMYRDCVYAEEIKTCMLAKEKIREVLNKFRKEPLPETWFPLHIYCEKCKKDEGRVTSYDNEYAVEYECTCGHKGKVNFKERGIVKLPWRVDWPMRWHFEKVDFEPGGKDHSAPGGSWDTGSLIIKVVFNEEPPVYQMYDFVIPKGGGVKFSKSLGNVLKLTDVLEIYLPEIIRFMFAGTKPVKEFSIPMDEDIFKLYEDFFKVERIYYGKEDSSRAAHWKRVYEMSVPTEPLKEVPIQPSFKHCVELIHIYRKPEEAVKNIKEKMDKEGRKRYLAMLVCAKNWIDKYAPEEYKFTVNEKVPDVSLMDAQKSAVRELGARLEEAKDEAEMVNIFNELTKKHGLTTGEFFKACYLILLSKERGPRLAPFIMAIGKERVAKLFKSV
ncbi:MAG: lysine--tRNA ligase [Candidatus Aenigmatarchaeota archaeon]